MEAPALNPTIGVQSKAPIGGLVYKKDSSRPGGGVFIAQGNSGESLPAGVYISDDVDSQSEGEDSPSPPHVDSFNDESSSSVLPLDLHMPAPAFASNASAAEVHRSLQLQDTTSGAGNSTIVNMMSMGGNFEGEQNVNPAMNSRMGTPGNVQVMNVLDVPQASNTLEQFAMDDFGLLEGIPGGMFDWGKPLDTSVACLDIDQSTNYRTVGHVLLAVLGLRYERRCCCAATTSTEVKRDGGGGCCSTSYAATHVRRGRALSAELLRRIIVGLRIAFFICIYNLRMSWSCPCTILDYLIPFILLRQLSFISPSSNITHTP